MKKVYYLLAMGWLMVSCTQKEPGQADAHQHEDVKLQLSSYSDSFEVYAEADPFVVGKASNILAHFTQLPAFIPLSEGAVTISMITGSKGIRQTIEEPLRPGIYSFSLTPLEAGSSQIIFEIRHASGESKLTLTGIDVYAGEHDAVHEADERLVADPNAIVFSKEQSWKLAFATEEVCKGNFHQVIRASARIQPARGRNFAIAALTPGIVEFSGRQIYEGVEVLADASLFTIVPAGLATGNSYVRYVEAQNQFELASANYERKRKLADDRLVTESELQSARRDYETARVVLENLQQHFSEGAQIVKSPVNGFIGELHVSNGDYVEAGQTLLEVSRADRLALLADVPQKYAAALPSVETANIIHPFTGSSRSLEDLDGILVSYGKAADPRNSMIPVIFEFDNDGSYLPGSLAEVFILAGSGQDVISVPNTALLEEQGNFSVMLQLTPELFIRREVVTGPTDGFNTVIEEGLSEHDRIVSRGAIFVKLASSSGTLDPHAGHVH